MVISVGKQVRAFMTTNLKRDDRRDRVAEHTEFQIAGGMIGAQSCPSLNAVVYELAGREVAQADFFDWASI